MSGRVLRSCNSGRIADASPAGSGHATTSQPRPSRQAAVRATRSPLPKRPVSAQPCGSVRTGFRPAVRGGVGGAADVGMLVSERFERAERDGRTVELASRDCAGSHWSGLSWPAADGVTLTPWGRRRARLEPNRRRRPQLRHFERRRFRFGVIAGGRLRVQIEPLLPVSLEATGVVVRRRVAAAGARTGAHTIQTHPQSQTRGVLKTREHRIFPA
jgi:hypothetical protein